MITKRNARAIRAGITDGRKFVAACRTNPGWTSGNLRGLYGEAYSRTVLRTPWNMVVRIENADPLLGRYGVVLLWPSNKKLTPGVRIEQNGRSGVITHVSTLSLDSDLVALVDWDE